MKRKQIHMALLIASIAIFNMVPISSLAQEGKEVVPFKGYLYVQPNIGISQYFGDLNQKDFWSQNPQFAGGIIFGYQLSPMFGVRAQSMKTVLYSVRTDQNTALFSDLWDNALNLTFNVNEVFGGYNYLRFINFYLYTGGGVSSFKSYLEVAEPRVPVEKHAKMQNSFCRLSG